MRRTGEIHRIFESVWGTDASQIVRVFQGWAINPTATQMALAYGQAHGIGIDVVAIAPYIDFDMSSPSIQMAAAALVAGDTRSIANAANGGPGVVMPMAAYQDLVRHFVKYNGSWNGPNGSVALHLAAMAKTGYSSAKLAYYECALSTVIPPGVSKTAKVVRAGLTHDFMYDPSYYATTQTFLQWCQQPGPSGTVGADAICIENLIAPATSRSTSFNCTDGPDNSFVTLWGSFICGRASSAGG